MDIDKFMGDWHMLHTNIKMWHEEGVRNPRIHHTKTSGSSFSDTITYESPALARGKTKENVLRGEDKLKSPGDTAFVWKGTRALGLLSMECQVGGGSCLLTSGRAAARALPNLPPPSWRSCWSTTPSTSSTPSSTWAPRPSPPPASTCWAARRWTCRTTCWTPSSPGSSRWADCWLG
jgi:hypothetical protein